MKSVRSTTFYLKNVIILIFLIFRFSVNSSPSIHKYIFNHRWFNFSEFFNKITTNFILPYLVSLQLRYQQQNIKKRSPFVNNKTSPIIKTKIISRRLASKSRLNAVWAASLKLHPQRTTTAKNSNTNYRKYKVE